MIVGYLRPRTQLNPAKTMVFQEAPLPLILPWADYITASENFLEVGDPPGATIKQVASVFQALGAKTPAQAVGLREEAFSSERTSCEDLATPQVMATALRTVASIKRSAAARQSLKANLFPDNDDENSQQNIITNHYYGSGGNSEIDKKRDARLLEMMGNDCSALELAKQMSESRGADIAQLKIDAGLENFPDRNKQSR